MLHHLDRRTPSPHARDGAGRLSGSCKDLRRGRGLRHGRSGDRLRRSPMSGHDGILVRRASRFVSGRAARRGRACDPWRSNPLLPRVVLRRCPGESGDQRRRDAARRGPGGSALAAATARAGIVMLVEAAQHKRPRRAPIRSTRIVGNWLARLSQDDWAGRKCPGRMGAHADGR